MAFQSAGDLAQADRTGQLPIKQGDELAPRRTTPTMLVRTVRIHKPFQGRPRNTLQKAMKDAILVPHAVDPLLMSEIVAKRSNTSRINTVHLVHKI
jgi:hypothetical protein